MKRALKLRVLMMVLLLAGGDYTLARGRGAVFQGTSQLPLKIAFEPSVTKAIVFTGDATPHASYEMFVTNYNKQSVRIDSLQITGTKEGRETFSRRYEGDALSAVFSTVAGDYLTPQDPVLPPGASAMLFIFLDFDSTDAVPTLFANSIEVHVEGDKESLQTINSSVGVRIISAKHSAVSPPLAGTNWWTPNGPSNFSTHRRTTIVLDEQVRHPEQFAVDWVKVGRNGATFAGDPAKNTSYFAYGSEILSAGNGQVVSVLDGITENVPNAPPVISLTVHNLGGNHVVVDMGQGQYAFYAHMIPGSIRVRIGDRVHRGEVLGLLGNSGNSSQPHLHFHVMDGPHPVKSRGLPFVINRFIRRDYKIICDSPDENCDPLVGPTKFVLGPAHWVFNQTFMNENLGYFVN